MSRRKIKNLIARKRKQIKWDAQNLTKKERQLIGEEEAKKKRKKQKKEKEG